MSGNGATSSMTGGGRKQKATGTDSSPTETTTPGGANLDGEREELMEEQDQQKKPSHNEAEAEEEEEQEEEKAEEGNKKTGGDKPAKRARTSHTTTNNSGDSSSKVPTKAETTALQDTSSHDDDDEYPKFNPFSKWEEPPILLDGPAVTKPVPLTLYDLYREPVQVDVQPQERLRVPLKMLSSEFSCPICLGYMKKTSLVMECLHRFCGECIQKCLRLGKKECPKCRIHIPSRRSLRPDPTFDELIRKIYGNIEELEKDEEKAIETLNKAQNMNNAYAESRKLGLMQQAMQRKKKQSSNSRRKASQSSSSHAGGGSGGGQGGSQGGGIVGWQESPLVDFLLRRHPQERTVERLYREYIRTSREITMKNLKTFLGQKLEYNVPSHFQLIVSVGGKSVVLEDSMTLEEVVRDICDEPTPGTCPMIQYRIMPLY